MVAWHATYVHLQCCLRALRDVGKLGRQHPKPRVAPLELRVQTLNDRAWLHTVLD